jgi:hypothetical protein
MRSRLSIIWIATAFIAGSALGGDNFPSFGPSSTPHKELQSRCAGPSAQQREQCMRDAEAADEKAGRHCADLTMQARAQCLADAQASAQQQASDQAAGGPQAGASTGGLPTPATASPGNMNTNPR